jgi:thiol-disulfide isomerase/thioredoxin
MTDRSWRAPATIIALALLGAIAGLVAGGWWFTPAREDAGADAGRSIGIGERRPDIVLPDLDGSPQALAQFDGAPLLINYWATWCAPCIEELPRLADAHARRDVDGVAVLAIALEYDSTPVADFLREHGSGLPVWIESPSANDSSVRFGNVRSVLPYSVLLDAAGNVIARKAGALSDEDLAGWVRQARR